MILKGLNLFFCNGKAPASSVFIDVHIQVQPNFPQSLFRKRIASECGKWQSPQSTPP
jgi:hypothetical protein